ncbi:MAG: hypothetical protein ABEJ65_00135 [bacterium]
MSSQSSSSSLVDQVESLYEEKEKLCEELGVSSIDEAIKMVKNLQEQVESLYADKDANA